MSVALSSILTATAQGELTPDEAVTIAGVLEAKRKAIETVEIEARLAVLERAGNRAVTGRLRRRLAALEGRSAEQRLGVVIVSTWLAGAEREAWIAVRAVELPPGQGFVVIPDKGQSMEGGHA